MSDVLGGFEHRVMLALVRLGARTYSVAVVQELERSLGRVVAPAAVYVTLRRLERRGLLSSAMVPPEPGEGGRARRFFAITPEGLDMLKSARADFERLWDGVETLAP